MRKWDLLTASLDPRSEVPLFLQLANAVAEGVAGGQLRPGDALPGTRVLAEKLAVHRNTVIAGYRELRAQGLVSTRPGGGTFVAQSARTPTLEGATRHARSPSYSLPEAPTPRMTPKPRTPRGVFNLLCAIPDTRLLPAEAIARAFRTALERHGRKLLGYTEPRGHERLRQELATMLCQTRGLVVGADDLLITRGSQHALFLIAGALLAPGDAVAVEALGNPITWAALERTGAELVPVPVDDGGMDVDALEALLCRRPLRAVYVTPNHQFPTNAVMGEARRARLGALAIQHRFAILEDDYDHGFHYEGRPLPPLAAGVGGANVLYVGSLSKVLAPGLRIGYVAAPPPVLERLATLREVCDMQGDATVECAVAELFEEGEIHRHLRRVRQAYARRRDALAAALERSLGGVLRFRAPVGGMAIWAGVEEGVDIRRWSSASEALGVWFRGADVLDFLGRERRFLRLGFTQYDAAELGEAVARMARALPKAAHNNRSHSG